MKLMFHVITKYEQFVLESNYIQQISVSALLLLVNGSLLLSFSTLRYGIYSLATLHKRHQRDNTTSSLQLNLSIIITNWEPKIDIIGSQAIIICWPFPLFSFLFSIANSSALLMRFFPLGLHLFLFQQNQACIVALCLACTSTSGSSCQCCIG